MSRQRLPIGTHEEITVMTLSDGRVEVRTRYRDFDGKSPARVGPGELPLGRRSGAEEATGRAKRTPTAHMFRRTVATVINDLASVNLAAELLDSTFAPSPGGEENDKVIL